MAKRSRVITMAPLVLDHEEDDLSFWEFVNPSDADYSDDSFSVDSLPDDVISLDSSSPNSPSPSPQTLPEVDGGDGVPDLDLGGGDCVDDGRGGSWPQMLLYCGDSGFSAGDGYGCHGYSHDNDEGNEDHGHGDGDDDGDGGGDDDDVDDDLDDELVPRSVSGKLGRQRMRKLGKRAFSKVFTSKTSPYSHLKPGCVRGKHGLGMKFRC
ncbi:PREDICTED: uncharacterized protein LOC104807296 [Tarenaya hassleriana]|uniref:uncharacterized protein LOC104807296 n=1 Tax=Tarenaya hassleriana TaxID=28532 RepID=UPI00053C8869|nr:PREDICTED: uncharacterized protein LOC104807296 [Tarenaya hassleriana]